MGSIVLDPGEGLGDLCSHLMGAGLGVESVPNDGSHDPSLCQPLCQGSIMPAFACKRYSILRLKRWARATCQIDESAMLLRESSNYIIISRL